MISTRTRIRSLSERAGRAGHTFVEVLADDGVRGEQRVQHLTLEELRSSNERR
jgi:hypothetical protein